MMGECLKEGDYEGASRHYDDTTSRYASSGKGGKAFDQAINCHEKIGKSIDQVDRLVKGETTGTGGTNNEKIIKSFELGIGTVPIFCR